MAYYKVKKVAQIYSIPVIRAFIEKIRRTESESL